MYQHELFSNQVTGRAQALASGCFATVYAVRDDWVVKKARTKDGTLNWLEWCWSMQQAGRHMRGMPVLDFLTVTTHEERSYAAAPIYGYVVGMRRYSSFRDWRSEQGLNPSMYAGTMFAEYVDKVPYLKRLSDAYREHFLDVLYDGCATRYVKESATSHWNDLHAGNMMMDEDGTFIITDPSSNAYLQPTPCWGLLEEAAH